MLLDALWRRANGARSLIQKLATGCQICDIPQPRPRDTVHIGNRTRAVCAERKMPKPTPSEQLQPMHRIHRGPGCWWLLACISKNRTHGRWTEAPTQTAAASLPQEFPPQQLVARVDALQLSSNDAVGPLRSTLETIVCTQAEERLESHPMYGITDVVGEKLRAGIEDARSGRGRESCRERISEDTACDVRDAISETGRGC